MLACNKVLYYFQEYVLTATAGDKAEILYLNALDAMRIKAARKSR